MTTETAPAPTEVALDATMLAGSHDRLGHIEGQLPHFATKADVANLRTEMPRGFAELRADGERLRADMERLRADFERQQRLMTWTLGSDGRHVAAQLRLCPPGPAVSKASATS